VHDLLISDESRLDILEAFSWYESRRPGLGRDFEIYIEAGLNLIAHSPFLSQKRYRNLRIHFINKFPYGIHYLIEDQTIKVFGVFHTSRDPANWQTRLKSNL
jgi:hypothetical protein